LKQIGDDKGQTNPHKKRGGHGGVICMVDGPIDQESQVAKDAHREQHAPVLDTAEKVEYPRNETDDSKNRHPDGGGEISEIALSLSQRGCAASDQDQSPEKIGKYAKVKGVPPQQSNLWGENVGKNCPAWNPGLIQTTSKDLRRYK